MHYLLTTPNSLLEVDNFVLQNSGICKYISKSFYNTCFATQYSIIKCDGKTELHLRLPTYTILTQIRGNLQQLINDAHEFKFHWSVCGWGYIHLHITMKRSEVCLND